MNLMQKAIVKTMGVFVVMTPANLPFAISGSLASIMASIVCLVFLIFLLGWFVGVREQ